MRNKEYTNNKCKYQREERIQISSVKEMGHRVVGEVAIGAGGVIGPAYGLAVGLEPRAIAGSELRGGTSVGPEQKFFGWDNCREVAMSTLLGA